MRIVSNLAYTNSVSIESCINIFVPLVFRVSHLSQSMDKSLVHTLIETICLGMVGATDSMFHTSAIKQGPKSIELKRDSIDFQSYLHI